MTETVLGPESAGGQQPTNEPRGGQTSAEAAGSIRDRLGAPADNDEANSGGGSRGADGAVSSVQQPDGAAVLAASGRDEGQHGTPHVAVGEAGYPRHEEL